MPAERLAHLLRRSRVRAGFDERAMAKAVGVRLKELQAWESGADRPDDESVQRYASVCGLSVDELLRRRDVVEVDLRSGTMRVGSSVARFDWRTTSNDMVLHTYLGLVREQRSLRSGQAVPFRDDDAESLSVGLDLSDPQLEARLAHVFGLPTAEAARVRERMLRFRMRAAQLAAARRGPVPPTPGAPPQIGPVGPVTGGRP